MLEELGKAGVRVDELVLAPLGLDTSSRCSATPCGWSGRVRPLAAVLLQKTDGNPFFLQQFLTALRDQKLLAFDAERGRWVWDEAQVAAAVASDNVVDLMVARLRRLSDAAREVLTLGACIGPEWSLGMLSEVAGRPGGRAAGGDLGGPARGRAGAARRELSVFGR